VSLYGIRKRPRRPVGIDFGPTVGLAPFRQPACFCRLKVVAVAVAEPGWKPPSDSCRFRNAEEKLSAAHGMAMRVITRRVSEGVNPVLAYASGYQIRIATVISYPMDKIERQYV
jgi:hypothetical protein